MLRDWTDWSPLKFDNALVRQQEACRDHATCFWELLSSTESFQVVSRVLNRHLVTFQGYGPAGVFPIIVHSTQSQKQPRLLSLVHKKDQCLQGQTLATR